MRTSKIFTEEKLKVIEVRTMAKYYAIKNNKIVANVDVCPFTKEKMDKFKELRYLWG